MNKISKWLKESLIIIAVFAIVAGLYVSIEFVFLDIPLSTSIKGIGSFICFGILLGGIFAFDPQSELKVKPNLILRIIVGIFTGSTLGFIWQWPIEGIILSTLISTILAALGMAWAKHINF